MKKAGEWALALGCALLCALLLACGDAARAGARAGLRACARELIPALYLFMAVSGVIAHSGAGDLLSRPFAPLTRRLYKLPASAGSAILLSFLGGYPVGAKAIAILLERKKLTKAQAQRAICFCCNAGPSFVVTAVGARMLGSARAGAALLCAHVLSALLIGLLLALRLPPPPEEEPQEGGLPFAQALVAGVNDATRGMLQICAYVVTFSALGALLRENGLFSLATGWIVRLLPLPGGQAALESLLPGLLEVTTGCMLAAELPGTLPAVYIPLLVSFAGLSVFFQVRTILQPYGLRFGPFVRCRLCHAGLTLLGSYPFLREACRTAAAFGSGDPPVCGRTPNTPLITPLLLLCSACLLLRVTTTADPRHD